MTDYSLNKIDISGNWKYQLDSTDNGLAEEWFKTDLKNTGFKLPGTTSENELGKLLNIEPELNEYTVKQLRQKYKYVGPVWYQKEIKVPLAWKHKRITLFLERVMFQSMVWIGNNKVGEEDSLSTPHLYNLTDYIKAGENNLLTIRIDNRDIQNIGTEASAYTNATQTIWNGIIGKLELRVDSKVFIKNIQIYPAADASQIKIKIDIKNITKMSLKAGLEIKIKDNKENIVQKFEYDFNIKDMLLIKEFECKLKAKLKLWDEFNPNLYKLELLLKTNYKSKKIFNKKIKSFGVREFKNSSTGFLINGRKTFLRGTLDCCIYPLTGYPPTRTSEWKKIFAIVKNYGLNHVRFHSWCPPEAAFIAADYLGIYLQIEGPVWMDNWNLPVGKYPEHYDYLPKEAEKIIDTYGNHPSFVMFSNGNELNGDFDLLHDIIAKLKNKDNRHLYTLTSNWDRKLDQADDFFVTQSVDEVGIRGQYFHNQMVETTMLNYKKAVELRNVPIISHEIGQYTVYPDVNEIEEYTGVLKPINFEVIKKDLAEKRLLNDLKKFVEGSGQLAVQLYKDEIEAAMKTSGFGGFQLLALHDFPGQSTATVGILNSFWKSKGLISGEEFSKFCGPIILLLNMNKRIYNNQEAFLAKIKIANYSNKTLKEVLVDWVISKDKKNIIASGSFSLAKIELGQIKKIGKLADNYFEDLNRASKLNISLSIRDTNISNEWNIWVYPENKEYNEDKLLKNNSIIISNSYNEKIENNLKSGKKVLLIPFQKDLNKSYKGEFFPVFWSPVHFKSKAPCGIYCNSEHPIFNEFPTDYYSSYQWKDLLDNSVSICLDNLSKEISPVVQVIPNFFYNHKLGNILEFKVGNGRLIICSIDIINNLKSRITARQLRKSIISYMVSNKFDPVNKLNFKELKKLFNLKKDKIKDYNILSVNKAAKADSELSFQYAAKYGNDNNDKTYWKAGDYKNGHWWQVDLGQTYKIIRTRVIFLKKANYFYVIKVSNDGENWRTIINNTGQINNKKVSIDEFHEKARYVRIIYNGLPSGIRAGHQSFEVYGY
jgi:hypothetical protein